MSAISPLHNNAVQVHAEIQGEGNCPSSSAQRYFELRLHRREKKRCWEEGVMQAGEARGGSRGNAASPLVFATLPLPFGEENAGISLCPGGTVPPSFRHWVSGLCRTCRDACVCSLAVGQLMCCAGMDLESNLGPCN